MTVIGIAIIVLLIVLLKMHAFLALTIGALFVGITCGIPLGDISCVLGGVSPFVLVGADLTINPRTGGGTEVTLSVPAAHTPP